MRSQTMIAPVVDERVLEQLEAEFLRSPIGFGPSWSELSLPAVETLAPAPGWPVDDDEQARVTLYKTTRYCCAG